MEVQDIYKDLPDPGMVNEEEEDVYTVSLRKLNVPYEGYVFRQLASTQR